MERNKCLTKLRPEISSIEAGQAASEAELFQNEVLRPILKFQNIAIHEIFKSSIQKLNLETLQKADQRQRIKRILDSDLKLMNQLYGVIIGLMTESELSYYIASKSEVHKRIKSMMTERLILHSEK